MPKVSIIMGTYNVNNDNKVKIAIDSIINQTFKDFEFIICDDGSTDGSYEYLMKLVDIDKRIILIKNDINKGLAYTLNRCLNIATGEYIARMDSDDICYPTRLEEQVSFLDNNKQYDIVGCNAELIDDNGVWGELKHIECPQKRDFLFGSRFIHPTIMMKKKSYQLLKGYRVSKETIRGQDYDLFMRAYSLGCKGYNIQRKLYQYREDKNSYRKRTYKNRINESIIRYKGFKQMGLLPKGYIYVFKPLLVGLIPARILKFTKKIRGNYI